VKSAQLALQGKKLGGPNAAETIALLFVADSHHKARDSSLAGAYNEVWLIELTQMIWPHSCGRPNKRSR
jgi:hypothetical protein